MRFFVGQVYQCSGDGRQATVMQVRNEGREGLLQAKDTDSRAWCPYEPSKWHLTSWPKSSLAPQTS